MEVEVKLRVDAAEVAALQGRLHAHGAASHGTSLQVDTYFEHPARDLVAADEALRVRSADGFEITYKGPRTASDFKAREELNLTTAEDPRPLLEALGFRAAARLSKRRQAWHLGGCDVLLDQIEGLGWFVEIEADAGQADPEAAIEQVRRALQLEENEAVAQSYLGMALAQGAAGVTRL